MPESFTGILESNPRGGAHLRSTARSFNPDPGDPWVSPKQIKQFGLIDGATVTGTISTGKKGPRLETVDEICGGPPEDFTKRTLFENLTAINPEERFHLGKDVTMRVVELTAPIAHGTRGLIVAPPKTGKTTILEQLAKAIHADSPDTRVVVLLVDERPEEVTHFRRVAPAEVVASSSDQEIASHVRLAEMTMQMVRCDVECGRNVVVLCDSITRLGRAFNSHGAGSRRTLSGGLDARALEVPRKFFGMARNVEHGGSVTVIATALIETGSRMDDLIFEEFKGTGNSEIVLSRTLAEQRVYPALDLRASGTRRDDLLYTDAEMQALNILRRRMVEAVPRQAVEGLLLLVEKYPTNEALLAGVRS